MAFRGSPTPNRVGDKVTAIRTQRLTRWPVLTQEASSTEHRTSALAQCSYGSDRPGAGAAAEQGLCRPGSAS